MAREPVHAQPFAPVVTARVRLRPVTGDDAEALAPLMTPAICQWTGTWRPPVTVSYARMRLEQAVDAMAAGTAVHAVVERIEGDVPMGWMLVRTGAAPRVGELGYWIGEAFQGHGYTREAVPHLLRLAFARLRVDRIEAGAQPGNVASFRVMRGLGMEPVGPRQVWAPAREREETCRYFAISRADFDAARESHRGS